MSFSPSPEQQRVIDSRGKNLLVSAAAGSGKTTVLVERVLGLLKEGTEIDKILIVTFTRAASADMKNKLFERLSKEAENGDEKMAEQLEKLDMAQISTLHSFCSAAVKMSFEAAEVDPNFRVMEESEEALLCEDALTQALEELLEKDDPGMDRLMLMRGPETVRQMARELKDFLDTRSDPDKWLADALEMFGGAGEEWQKALVRACKKRLDDALDLLYTAGDVCRETDGPGHYLACIEKDTQALKEACGIESYETMRVWAEEFKSARAPGGKSKNADFDIDKLERVKSLRESAKKRISEIKELTDIPLEVALNDIHSDREAFSALAELYLGFRCRLGKMKQEKAAVSFNDLEHLTLKILDDPDTLTALKERYSYIFIDEYQDTSDIQEAIACRLASGSNRFMVGDVKQSIYRFRHAEPELFIKAYETYKQGGDNELVVLSRNYRSSQPVIDLVNLIFGRVMRGGDSEILYDDDAMLHPGPKAGEFTVPCELMILDRSALGEEEDEPEETEGGEVQQEDELKSSQLEARLIGKRIKELMDEDKSLRYRDFCVICRTRKDVLAPMAETLGEMGIPSYADGTENSFEAIEVSVTLNVLKVLVNRYNEVALLSVARSPMFYVTNSALAQARIRCPEGLIWDAFAAVRQEYPEIDRLLTMMENWRAMAPGLGVRALIRRILEDTGFYVFCGALEGGRRRQMNLDLLCKRAEDYENDGGCSIAGFTRLMEHVAGSSDGDGAHELGENDDVVRLMTAHKSKGLEFKVVFAAQLARKYSAGIKDGSMFLDKQLGAGFVHMDERLGTARPTLATRAVRNESRIRDRAEELRVLYVTLTRAQQRLILVGSVKELEKSLVSWKMAAARPDMYYSSLDIAASAAIGCPGAEVLGGETDESLPRVNVKVFSEKDALKAVSADAKQLVDLFDAARGAAPKQDILERLMWEYPASEQSALPVKLSVTGLERETVGGSELPRLKTVPRFLSGEGDEIYTQRGTANHRALRLFDLDALKACSGEKDMLCEVARQLDGMLERQLISPEERSLCREGDLARFWLSDTGRRALASNEVKREWSFVIRLKLSDALGSGSDDTVLVQGTLDMCFEEDGKWVLVDYKTDRSGDESEILARYGTQLDIYRRALNRLTGREVRHTYICLISRNRRLEV